MKIHVIHDKANKARLETALQKVKARFPTDIKWSYEQVDLSKINQN